MLANDIALFFAWTEFAQSRPLFFWEGVENKINEAICVLMSDTFRGIRQKMSQFLGRYTLAEDIAISFICSWFTGFCAAGT